MPFAAPTVSVTENVVHVAAIDRVGNETHRAVRHTDVHAAAVVRRRGNAEARVTFVLTVIFTVAARAVRRNRRVEVRIRRARVAPTSTFNRPRRAAVRHTVRAAHRQARRHRLTVNRRRYDRRLVHNVAARRFRRVDLAEDHRVRRAVRYAFKTKLSSDIAVEETAAHIPVFAPVGSDHEVAATARVVARAAVLRAKRLRLILSVRRAKERVDRGRKRVRLTVVHLAASPSQRNRAVAPAVRILTRRLFTIARNRIEHGGLFNERKERRLARVRVDNVNTGRRTVARVTLNPIVVVPLVRNAVVMILEVVDRQTKLFEVVRALHATSGLARGLNRRKKKTN